MFQLKMQKAYTGVVLVIFSIIFVGILVFIYIKLNISPSVDDITPPSPTTIPTPSTNNELKRYVNQKYGYEFQYPNNLVLSDKNNIPVISHSIPFQNNGGCDMSGLSPMLSDLTDFMATFEIKPANFYPYDSSDGEVTLGGLNGKYYTNGVEGCGEVEYYFQVGSKTLLIKKTLIQALELSSQSDEILKIPGVISPNKSKEILAQILSTFTFIDQNTMTVRLYFHNPSLDPNYENIIANDYKEIQIPKTTTPLKDSINALIKLFVSEDEKTYGTRVTSFKLKSATIVKGVAKLIFEDPESYTSGGSTRVNLIYSQIEKTALQFPNIKKVEITGAVFQP